MKICLFVICTVFICVIKGQYNPCPNILTQNKADNYINRWNGLIHLHSDEELNGIFITIILDRQADTLGNWFGETVTRNNKEFTIKKNDFTLVPGINVTMKFYVEFNGAEIPSVTTIRLNGRTICSDQKKIRPQPNSTPYTSMKITTRPQPLDNQEWTTTESTNYRQSHYGSYTTTTESTYRRQHNRPSTESNRRRNNTSSNSDTGTRNKTFSAKSSNIPTIEAEVKRILTDEFAAPKFDTSTNRNSSQQNHSYNKSTIFDYDVPSLLPKHSIICGKQKSASVSPLILHGHNTTDGEWPWHSAIYKNQEGASEYICGGSLLSERYIITAAHCVVNRDSGEVESPRKFVTYVGTRSINNFSPSVQIGQVSQIKVHEDYDRENFHNDIAILKVAKSFEYTDNVQPICLWDRDDDLDKVVGTLGTVVGWGYDGKHRSTEHLMRTQMPIVDTVACIYSNPDFFSKFTHWKSYCAGFRNGSGVCNGDSGSGMVIGSLEIDEIIWYLRGIVSVSVPIKNKSICDPFNYIVFTDVAKYVDWIKQIMK